MAFQSVSVPRPLAVAVARVVARVMEAITVETEAIIPLQTEASWHAAVRVHHDASLAEWLGATRGEVAVPIDRARGPWLLRGDGTAEAEAGPEAEVGRAHAVATAMLRQEKRRHVPS